jgi:methylated-DNA-[protein]-cysteine S-methyltransferase
MFDVIIASPIGQLGIKCQQDKVIAIEFLGKQIVAHPSALVSKPLKPIVTQLRAYFTNGESLCDVPFELNGTPFQKRVWQALRKIPLGETLTYGELAQKLNTSARAIGLACRKNLIPLVVPCHRIVAANHIGGFCGQTTGDRIDIKQWLLAHECQNVVAYSSQ